jgi:hypothetical protein
LEFVLHLPKRSAFVPGLKNSVRASKFLEGARYLQTHYDGALELGFNIDPDGNVIVPDHETLRHFEKVRIAIRGWMG